MRNCISGILRDSSVLGNWIKRNILILVLFLLIYFLNRHFKYYIDLPAVGYLCRCHLNDYIGGIVFCVYLNMLLVFNHRRPVLKLYHLLLIMSGVSILWEYFFPIFLSYSTSDFYDIIAYLLGTVTYYFLACRVPAKKVTEDI